MSLRTANIEVSLSRLPILRIEHPQANPLRLSCTLRTGESLPSGLQLTAEIHTSRTVPAETTPLAATTVTVGVSATTFEIDFTSAQTNQTVTPESTRPLWLVIYGVGDADALYTLATADLLLGWHAISRVTPPPPATAALVEKGGVAWVTARAYAAGTMVTVGTTAYVASSAHTSGSTTQPGTGASWATVWAVLSGGGGTTDLTMTRTPNAVTITPSGGGTAAQIPQANNNYAGVLTAAHHIALEALGTMSTQAANNVAITGGTITGTTVSGITLTNGGSGALTVTGTASIAGTTSGTNTGDQTITLTGDVTGSGTGSFAATIAADAVTTAKINDAAVTNAKLANASAFTIKANLTGSIAPPSDADLVDVASSLPVFGAAQRGMVPVTGAGTNARFLLANATWSDTLAFGTLTASDPFVISQTWNNGAVVFACLELTITQTAANSSSYFVRFRGGAAGATDRYSVQIDGTTTQSGGANWFGGSCGLSSGAGFFLNDSAARIQLGSTTGSPNLYRESDNALGIRNGTNAQTLRVNDTYGSTTDYHRVSIATVRASLSSISGASVTSTGLIPAGAIVVGVTAKVLTAITGATSWQLGTAADPDRFAASGGIALGSTTDNRNWTSGALECFLAATDVVLTANGSNFTGGAVYISVQYIRGEAD